MVLSRGTGRKDYSTDVQSSVIPIIRSYQVNATHLESFTLTAGQTKTIPLSLSFSTGSANHFVFTWNVSVDANVLIRATITSNGLSFGTYFGYGSIDVPIIQGLGLSQISLIVTNYSNVSVNGYYSHNGVQGTETIMPILNP